jgi:hypothetical protein
MPADSALEFYFSFFGPSLNGLLGASRHYSETSSSRAPQADQKGPPGYFKRVRAGCMDKLVPFTTAELVALDAAAVWFITELRARINRADSEVDREISADQMKHLFDARKRIHDARHST